MSPLIVIELNKRGIINSKKKKIKLALYFLLVIVDNKLRYYPNLKLLKNLIFKRLAWAKIPLVLLQSYFK